MEEQLIKNKFKDSKRKCNAIKFTFYMTSSSSSRHSEKDRKKNKKRKCIQFKIYRNEIIVATAH